MEDKRILSAMRFVKQVGDYRTLYKGYWLIDNIQCFCDGYMAVILNKHINEVEKAIDTEGQERLNILDIFKKYDDFEIYENIDLKKINKIKTYNGIYADISDSLFLNKRINIVKGMLGKNIKAYTKISKDSMMKDKVLILENENGKALILSTRKHSS
jgi:hypothetical protein